MLNTKITFIFTNDFIFPIFDNIQKSLKIVIFEICNILAKKYFFSKNFFLTIFQRWFQKFSAEYFFFFRYEFWSSDVFKTFFRKNTFLNIFLNTKSRNVRFSQGTLFLMLFKKKWLNLKKKVILALFLKNQFLVDFRKIENFFGSRYPKIFFSPLSYQSGPKLYIYAKKNIINHFRRIAWTLF